jgi:hypothetical protein
MMRRFRATPPWWWKPWLTPWFAAQTWWYRPRPVKPPGRCTQWVKFLRAPAGGPYWHEHPHR